MKSASTIGRSTQNNETLSSSPDVTVIIVNWNLQEYLRKCIESVQRHSGRLDVEIIVVDNASSDGSVKMVEREFPGVTLLSNTENAGFSQANNQAIEVARGRYYFLLNNDTLLNDGSLPSLVEFMDVHAKAGICGPRVINEDKTLQVRSKGRYPSILTVMGHFFLPEAWQQRSDIPLGFYEFRDKMDARPVDWVSGCALLVRREAVDSVVSLTPKCSCTARMSIGVSA